MKRGKSKNGIEKWLTVPREGGFLKVSVADPRINQTALKQAHDEFPLPGFDGVMALYSIPESIVEIHPIEMILVMLVAFGRSSSLGVLHNRVFWNSKI